VSFASEDIHPFGEYYSGEEKALSIQHGQEGSRGGQKIYGKGNSPSRQGGAVNRQRHTIYRDVRQQNLAFKASEQAMIRGGRNKKGWGARERAIRD